MNRYSIPLIRKWDSECIRNGHKYSAFYFQNTFYLHSCLLTITKQAQAFYLKNRIFPLIDITFYYSNAQITKASTM